MRSRLRVVSGLGARNPAKAGTRWLGSLAVLVLVGMGLLPDPAACCRVDTNQSRFIGMKCCIDGSSRCAFMLEGPARDRGSPPSTDTLSVTLAGSASLLPDDRPAGFPEFTEVRVSASPPFLRHVPLLI